MDIVLKFRIERCLKHLGRGGGHRVEIIIVIWTSFKFCRAARLILVFGSFIRGNIISFRVRVLPQMNSSKGEKRKEEKRREEKRREEKRREEKRREEKRREEKRREEKRREEQG